MPTPFTDEDKAFIRAILNNPAELTGWLAYADWLDEHDDLRAEFIRLQIQLTDLDSDAARPHLQRQIAELASRLDPVWLAMVDRTQIENCKNRGPFRFRCPQKWQQLTTTRDENVRYCEACRENVVYCLTLAEARHHAGQGFCVAISRAVLRTPFDFNPEELPDDDVLGLLEEEDERDEYLDEIDNPDCGDEE